MWALRQFRDKTPLEMWRELEEKCVNMRTFLRVKFLTKALEVGMNPHSKLRSSRRTQLPTRKRTNKGMREGTERK